MIAVSCGWGIQSSCLVGMVGEGIIRADVVIHSDTGYERAATYVYAARMTRWLEERGVRVVTVSNPNPRITTDRPGGKIWIPAFTDTPGASGGQLRRQCTHRWKVQPIRRWLQANRNGQPVTMLLGISMDEWHRAKDSDVKYVTHEYPLLDLKMTRNDCVNWLERHGLEVPGKSACVFCPYHNRRAWQDMKRENGDDWRNAVAVDEAIRKVRPPYNLFLHQSRIQLVDVDLSTPEDHGQLRLLADEECDSGYCFL